MLIAGQPHFHSLGAVDLQVAPIDIPGGVIGAPGARADGLKRLLSWQAQHHVRSSRRSFEAGSANCSGGTATGAREFLTLASTTAMYGSTTAPSTGMITQYPGTRKQAKIHTSRMPMAMLYFTIRARRSSSGDRGSEVIDCCLAMEL